jgi:hypothetical protein
MLENWKKEMRREHFFFELMNEYRVGEKSILQGFSFHFQDIKWSELFSLSFSNSPLFFITTLPHDLNDN